MDASFAEVSGDVSSNVKKEEVVENNGNDVGSSSSRSPSPDTNCPICLGKLENKSFTDSCMHQFCFKCLQEWSKVKPVCPLCKQSFKSIIHTVRSNEDYEQYYLSSTATEGTVYLSREIFARLESPDATIITFPRTTGVSSYLDYFVRLEEAIHHRVLPQEPTSVSGGTLWQRRRQRGTSDFRRNIYQLGLWSQRNTEVTARVRECSPEFYRENPAQVHRLVPWLNRELNVLLYENSPHIQHVMNRILELITQVPIRSPGFAAVIAPYIGRNTEHFIHEFHNFAISPTDLVGYDRSAHYVGRSEVLRYSSTDSSDSDVQVLEENTASFPPIQLESDSDDCIVLDERDPTVKCSPEVITLDSDNDDVVQIEIQTEPQPCSSTSQPKPSTSRCPMSQPKPSTSRRPRLKRNWSTTLTLPEQPQPSTSNGNGCQISISIAHSRRTSRDLNPPVRPIFSESEDSSTSWEPVSRKPTRVKKKTEVKKRKRRPSRLVITSDSDDDVIDFTESSERKEENSRSRRKAKRPLKNKAPKVEETSIDKTVKAEEKPTESKTCTEEKIVKRECSSSKSSGDEDTLVIQSDYKSELSSFSESEYFQQLKSVVVKAPARQKPDTLACNSDMSSSSRSDVRLGSHYSVPFSERFSPDLLDTPPVAHTCSRSVYLDARWRENSERHDSDSSSSHSYSIQNMTRDLKSHSPGRLRSRDYESSHSYLDKHNRSSAIKSTPRYKSDRSDYDSSSSVERPSSSRRTFCYRSSRSRISSSSSERSQRKRCKHSKKRSNRNK